MEFREIQRAAKKSGLTMNEMATLFGVTRQTLYNWEKGNPTNSVIASRAREMLKAIQNATALGYLPLKIVVDRPRRMAKIKLALAESFKK